MKETKFKIGQKVKIINNFSGQLKLNTNRTYFKGEIGIITQLYAMPDRHEIDHSAFFKPEELKLFNSALIKEKLGIK